VFSALIGNGDMHLKNWSLICPDHRMPGLSPACDLLPTIPYIEGEDTAALNFSRTNKMAALSKDELAHLTGKAALPEKLVFDTARETVERFRSVWDAEKRNRPMSANVLETIDAHLPAIELWRAFTQSLATRRSPGEIGNLHPGGHVVTCPEPAGFISQSFSWKWRGRPR
jgi:serine/threonine-protein kinase HipA